MISFSFTVEKIVKDGPVYLHTYVHTYICRVLNSPTHRQYTAVTHEHIAHPHRQHAPRSCAGSHRLHNCRYHYRVASDQLNTDAMRQHPFTLRPSNEKERVALRNTCSTTEPSKVPEAHLLQRNENVMIANENEKNYEQISSETRYEKWKNTGYDDMRV